jgi:hypothetical protein
VAHQTFFYKKNGVVSEKPWGPKQGWIVDVASTLKFNNTDLRLQVLRMNGASGEGSQGGQPGNDDDPVRRYYQVNGVGPRDKF